MICVVNIQEHKVYSEITKDIPKNELVKIPLQNSPKNWQICLTRTKEMIPINPEIPPKTKDTFFKIFLKIPIPEVSRFEEENTFTNQIDEAGDRYHTKVQEHW